MDIYKTHKKVSFNITVCKLHSFTFSYLKDYAILYDISGWLAQYDTVYIWCA